MIQPQCRDADNVPDSQSSGVRSTGDRAICETIVIVGHGMVGQRVVEEIRRRPSLTSRQVIVLGAEPIAAYDRVHLGQVVKKGETGLLPLASDGWFEDKRVTLVVGDPVEKIDRDNLSVLTKKGRRYHYNHLILATGSLPVLGKIPGIDGKHVWPLRSFDDALKIHGLALKSREKSLPAVIIGAGLLGIELADELCALGVSVEIVESADYPLSRQLEAHAGRRMDTLLKERGMRLHSGARVVGIKHEPDAEVVQLNDGTELRAGLVVPAMGVRPRDALAREAGLHCDLFGGIEVDDQLLTSNKHISAVGECARHQGMIYGLVAPGYTMAATVAGRLAGEQVKFTAQSLGTRLKLSGIEFSCMGQSAVHEGEMRSYSYESPEVYRRLTVHRGRVIGIVSLGKWEELPRVQEAFARQQRIRPAHLKRFERSEPMWKDTTVSLQHWPDSATVCSCMGVNCGELKRAYNEGFHNLNSLVARTGAGTVCGSCRPLIATLTDEQSEPAPESSSWMLGFSLSSLAGALLFLLAPQVPYATTVQGVSIDFLWRNSLAKQCTGWGLFAIFLASVLFAMRKRLPSLRWGSFEGWRIVHALLGLVSLLMAFLHTGFRLGVGINRGLILVFLGSVFLGGLAGGWTLLEETLSPPAAQRLRLLLVRSHIYLLWPLPALVAAHILKVYFF